MGYNIHYDIAAIALLLIISVYFFYSSNVKYRRAVVFEYFVGSVFVATVFDLIAIFVSRIPSGVPLVVEYLLNDIYFLAVNAAAMIYFIYIYVSSFDGKFRLREFVALGGFYSIIVVMLIINPFTKWIFYFDENGVYISGPYHFTLYVISLAYLLMAFVRSVAFHRRLSTWQKICVYTFSAMMVGVVIFQAYYPKHMVLQYAEALSCLLFCFSLENPSDYQEKGLDIYNQVAFYDVFNFYASREKKFQVLAVQIDGLTMINEMFGISSGNEVVKEVANLLTSCVNKKKVFRLNGATFCILGSFSKDRWEEIQENITDRFRHPFLVSGTQISLNAPMCMLYYPDKVHSLDDAIDMITHALKQARNNAEQTVVIADDVILEKSRREGLVVQAVKNALVNDGLEVYYQPIYSTYDGRFTRAEALVRLHDEKLGWISPDEFIPLAEQKGLIVEVGAAVFCKVCQFIQRERIWEKGMERIDVNLSAVQCMQENLAERLIDLMDAYHVPYKAINLEITETAAVVSKENLRRNMEKLLEKGVNFSMDDYGSGYSNTMTIIEYPFTVVKLDKSILWTAMKKTQAMHALKYTIAMLNEMGFEVITEGIENTQMAAKLQMLGCQLHQGYYYSKPLPEREFLEVCQQQ